MAHKAITHNQLFEALEERDFKIEEDFSALGNPFPFFVQESDGTFGKMGSFHLALIMQSLAEGSHGSYPKRRHLAYVMRDFVAITDEGHEHAQQLIPHADLVGQGARPWRATP